MDKEILALIGKLYLDLYRQSSYIEALTAKISELEAATVPENKTKTKT